MNVTLANIRREYAVTRSRWAEAIGLAVAFLVACETVRQALRHGSAVALAAVAGLLVAALGWWAAARVAGGVRRATLDGELWRKFGLRPELTAACAALPATAGETASTLDRALGDLRSLAAVANHAEEDDPGDAVELGEEALLRAVRQLPDDAAQLGLVADALRLAFTGLTDTLSARQHGEAPAEAWDEFVAAREALRARLDPPAGQC